MRIIRHSDLVAVPWRNGGGITREVLRAPAGGERFDWRVSVAQIDASGPFSDFPGYERYMVLLDGAGLELSGPGFETRTLERAGQWLRFDGAPGPHCKLLGGPCVDFNLMVARGATAVEQFAVERLLAPMDVTPAAGAALLVFPIGGRVELRGRAGAQVLGRWDLGLIGAGEPVSIAALAQGEAGAEAQAAAGHGARAAAEHRAGPDGAVLAVLRLR